MLSHKVLQKPATSHPASVAKEAKAHPLTLGPQEKVVNNSLSFYALKKKWTIMALQPRWIMQGKTLVRVLPSFCLHVLFPQNRIPSWLAI